MPFENSNEHRVIQVVQTPQKLEILGRREPLIKGPGFRHVPETPLGVDGVLDDVEAGDQGAARRGANQSRQDLDRCRLAGAVRPKKAKNLAPLDAEVQVDDRWARAVVPPQVLCDDHGVGL